MELQSSMHMQHLNHGHGLGGLTSQHHHYQHQLGGEMDIKPKSKSKRRLKFC